MDKIDLEELERLAKAATPGPWEAILTPGWDEFLHTIRGGNGAFLFDLHNARNGEANAAYIVAACNAVPELIARVRELEAENRTLGERLCETEHDLTEALDKKEELVRRVAELAQENSCQKRVIQMLEYRVLELKGKPIPMEPRQFIPSSNRSNAKEAGE